jgi:hypothetical protein
MLGVARSARLRQFYQTQSATFAQRWHDGVVAGDSVPDKVLELNLKIAVLNATVGEMLFNDAINRFTASTGGSTHCVALIYLPKQHDEILELCLFRHRL